MYLFILSFIYFIYLLIYLCFILINFFNLILSLFFIHLLFLFGILKVQILYQNIFHLPQNSKNKIERKEGAFFL